jgi:hypothetical protein
MAAPANLTTVFPDRAGVDDILGEAGVKWRLDDDRSGALSTLEEAVGTRLYCEATAWVKFHLSKYDLSDYPATDNAGHWLVYRWACIRACLMLCKRRGNPAMGSLQAMYDEAKEYLEAIQAGTKTLADVMQVASPSMSLSNMRLDDRYHTRKQRVERTISDQIPAVHDQAKDWVSNNLPEVMP